MRFQVEVRRAGNEILPLLVLGLTSMLLVGGMAFAMQAPDTTTSIERTARVVFLVLGAGVLGMAAVTLGRGRPFDAVARVENGALFLERGGGSRQAARRRRLVYVLRDGDRWAVEIEQATGALRLLAADRDQAERLAGALEGVDRLPAAAYRLRRKADYYRFVTVVCVWTLVFAGLVVLPHAPVFGAIFLAIALPPGIWVALRAVPTVVIAAPYGIALLDPFGVERIPIDRIAGCRVVDDDAVLVAFREGGGLRLSELSTHPRDREASTAEPPAEKLAATMRAILEGDRAAA